MTVPIKRKYDYSGPRGQAWLARQQKLALCDRNIDLTKRWVRGDDIKVLIEDYDLTRQRIHQIVARVLQLRPDLRGKRAEQRGKYKNRGTSKPVRTQGGEHGRRHAPGHPAA